VSVASGGRLVTMRCTPAFALYKDALDEYTPERVEALTGVRAEDVVAVARMLAPGRRIAYHAWSGVGQHTNATQTERSIATLYALTGAFDTRGSNREFTKQPVNAVSTYALLSPQQRAKALGLDERPLGPPAQGWVTTRDVYQAITEARPYKVRALFAFGTNVVTSHADAGAAHEALCALDFHVHCDLFETPSSRYADIFLPVNTPWEREGLRVGFEINERAVELVQLRQRMVPPRGESRADYDIVLDLAMRLGMGDEFFGGSIEAGWNHILAPLGLDVAELRKHPEGIYRPLPQHEKNYALQTPEGVRGFKTETLRVELYSEKLLRHGYPPVPEYVPPQHGNDTHEDCKTYPHVVTSVKNGYYCHSQQRSLASLRKRAPYPTAELSTQLASEKGIVADDWSETSSSPSMAGGNRATKSACMRCRRRARGIAISAIWFRLRSSTRLAVPHRCARFLAMSGSTRPSNPRDGSGKGSGTSSFHRLSRRRWVSGLLPSPQPTAAPYQTIFRGSTLRFMSPRWETAVRPALIRW
jgi:anaerobic selenocysteine-containing dehydrogenase